MKKIIEFFESITWEDVKVLVRVKEFIFCFPLVAFTLSAFVPYAIVDILAFALWVVVIALNINEA